MNKQLLFLKLSVFSLLLLFSSGWAWGQVFTEDFTSGTYTVTLGGEGEDGTADYFMTTDGSNIGISYTGASGNFFAGQDIDDGGWTNSASPSQLTWSSIDITGITNLNFSCDFASAATAKIDNNDYLLFEYQVDAGGWNNLIAFENDGADYNTYFLEDTDFDGTGDGTQLTNTFATFSKSLSVSGSTLDLRITVVVDSGGEDFAIDNIILEEVVTSPTITVSETALTGFSYEEGSGPSAEQSFTVSGSDLTNDITLTPPTNYEISTGTGGSFSATNPITLTQSGGSVAETTIYVRLKAGLSAAEYNAEDISVASVDATTQTVSCSGSVYNQVGWANLQWPDAGTIARGDDYTVYAQVWEEGITDAVGQGAGITAWIGYSTTDSDPSTWTNWVPASFNNDSGNNDEYMANIGAVIAAPGTYYYASRFQQGSAPYYYGGYDGGAWDGTTNVSGVLTVTGDVSVIINEVDADTDGTEVDEFIELYDGGVGNTALDGLVLVLYNGSDDQSYTPVFDLDGYSTDANGYFVIGGTGVAEADYVVSSTYWIQNGTDAVALYYGNDTDFPNDTPITTTNLIDAMVYDTSDGDDAGLLVLLNASEPQVDENSGGNVAFESNQRFPNGTGGARNTSTYIQAIPTPGAMNIAQTTWVGGATSDPTDPTNWTFGVPTANHQMIIPAMSSPYPVISGALSANSVLVEAGGELTISATGVLTVDNPAEIYSDATASGSLIVETGGSLALNVLKSTADAPANLTYYRYLTGGQWHLIGAPVLGQVISTFMANADNDISNDGTNYKMKDYAESADAWSSEYDMSVVSAMVSGKGYALTRVTDGVVETSGILVTTDVPFSLSNSANGWNLLANPYPAALKATTDGSTDYLLNASNVAELDPSYAALYVWEENTIDPSNVNNYKTVNNALDGTLYKVSPQAEHLQAGQAFFVKAGGTGNFTFNVNMLQHQSDIPLYKSDANSWSSVELSMRDESAKASTKIAFNSAMTKGLDVTYDAGLLTSNPDFSVYTRLVEDNGVDFMLQALPDTFEGMIVPVGVKANAGDILTFSANMVNVPEMYNVFLEDRALNVFTNLSEGDEYSVQLTDNSDGTGRFFIRTTAQSALGVGDLTGLQALKVFAQPSENQLVIRGEMANNATARIYSITGKLVSEVNLQAVNENRINFNEETGVYIVKINTTEGMFTQKISWIK